ncbi:MAG: peroxiredoxin, partial [Pseudomonadota bacterium]
MSDFPVAGDAMPDIEMGTPDGGTVKPSDFAGKKLVIFFYPKDNTPGCTKESCQFRDAEADFAELEAAILGMSPDDVKSKAKFAEKFDLSFPILADPGAKTCEKYGVWQEKSMYGKKYMGVVRTTYLIDPKGKVAERWDKVKVPSHAEAVMDR